MEPVDPRSEGSVDAHADHPRKEVRFLRHDALFPKEPSESGCGGSGRHGDLDFFPRRPGGEGIGNQPGQPQDAEGEEQQRKDKRDPFAAIHLTFRPPFGASPEATPPHYSVFCVPLRG